MRKSATIKLAAFDLDGTIGEMHTECRAPNNGIKELLQELHNKGTKMGSLIFQASQKLTHCGRWGLKYYHSQKY